MTSTTAHGLPIPTETDPLGATDERIVELAEYLDSTLLDPKVYADAAAYTLLDLQPAWTDLGHYPAMQRVPGGMSLVVCGPLVQLTIRMKLFPGGGGSYAPPASGDVPNFQLDLLINNPAFRPLAQVPGSSQGVGRVAAFALTPSGQVFLTAVGGSASIDDYDETVATFTYLRRLG